MALDIDELQIEIEASSDQAEKKLDRLIAVIGKLQAATERCTGLSKLNSQIRKLSEITDKFSSLDFGTGKIKNFVSGINALNDVNTPNLTKLRNQMDKLSQISDNLNAMPDISDNVSRFVTAVKPFESMGKSNIGSYINSLKKLPEILKQLDSADLDGFSRSVSKVTAAITPLANAMGKLGSGYSALPKNIKQVVSSNSQLEVSSRRVEKTQTSLSSVIGKTKVRMLAMFYAANRVADSLSECLTSSNDYIENLNLFTVAMGDGAKAALDYAETVNDALGIDVSEWIRNQGTFKQITTGFGVAEDKANLMSKNLTQLGYDISSFFNIDIEESMQKLQSGISGEIEPLRRLGYAIDTATLQQTAYDYGIRQNINTMTQAQKSQLRYLAIMEQSGNAMGDMARTIITPSNSMRVLNQQFEQLKRAIGNVVSVFAVKLIPYIQVAVRLLTDLANSLAKKWGFELPEIDYGDGLSGITDEMSDLTDNAESAGESISEMAKEVQRLAGFDELNILSSDKLDVDTGADKAKDELTGINDWQLDLPEYDFLEGLNKQTDELYKKAKKKIDDIINKFKDLKKWIEKNKATVEKFGKALLGIWVVKKVNDFIKALSGVDILKSAVSWASDFFKFFKQSEATTFFGKFKDGAKNARDQMTPLTKLVGTLVGAVTAGVGSYNLFKDLTDGTLTWKGALADSALIVGGLATSWIFGGLPGLGVAAVAALFSGLAGTVKAAKDEAEKALELLINSEWSTGIVPITDLKDAFNDYADALTNSESTYLESVNSIELIAEDARTAANNLGILIDDLCSAKLDPQKLDEVKVSFDNLAESASTYITESSGAIKTYLFMNADILEQQGISVGQVMRAVDEASSATTRKLAEVQAETQKLLDKGVLTTVEKEKLDALRLEMLDIAGIKYEDPSEGLKEVKVGLENLMGMDISFDNVDLAKQSLDEMIEKFGSAYKNIERAREDALAKIETLEFDTKEQKQGVIDAINAIYDVKVEDLKPMYESLHNVTSQIASVWSQVNSDIEQQYSGGFLSWFSPLGIDLSKYDYDTNKVDEELGAIREKWGSFATDTGEYLKHNLIKSMGISGDELNQVLGEEIDTVALTTEKRLDNLAQNMWGVTYGDVIQSQISAGSEDLGHAYITGFSGEISTDAKIVMEAVGKLTKATFNESLKKQQTKNGGLMYDAFMQGYINSALKNSAKAEEPSTKLGSIAVSALKTELDSHSPSKVTEKIGKDFDMGFVNGITGNSTIVIFSVVSLVSQITSAFSGIDLTDTGKNIGESLSNGFSEGLRGVVDSCNSTLWRFELFEIEMMNAFNDAVPAFQQMANGISTVVGMGLGNIDFINYTSRGRQIPGYATGGYPRRADLFYANENGVPEMVGRIGARTAVANTDQITTAIAAAVRAAIRESGGMQSGNSSKQQGDTYIFLDSDEISYKIEQRSAAKAKMTGGMK